MRKGLKLTFVFALILATALALFVYFDLKRAVQIIVPEFENIEEAAIELIDDSLFMDARLLFLNKSFLRLNLDSFIYEVTLDSLKVLSKKQDVDLRLSPGQTDTLNLPFALPFRRLSSKIEQLQSKDSTTLTFDLRLVYSTLFGRAVLPFKKTSNIAVPVPPKFEIVELDYVERNKGVFYMIAHVRIINQGKLDLDVSDLTYELTVDDAFDAKGFYAKGLHLVPRTDTVIDLPVEFKVEHLVKTLVRSVAGIDKANYHFTVRSLVKVADFGKRNTPVQIEKRGTIELKK